MLTRNLGVPLPLADYLRLQWHSAITKRPMSTIVREWIARELAALPEQGSAEDDPPPKPRDAAPAR